MSTRQVVIGSAVIFIIGALTGVGLISQWVLKLDQQQQINLNIALTPWFSVLTTVATIVIAIAAAVSYRLASTIRTRDDEFRDDAKTRDEEFRQQVSDLYQAIVISNIVTEKPGMRDRVNVFKDFYKGKTPIFKEGG